MCLNAQKQSWERYIGLDIHKKYLVAIGVNSEGEQIYGPRKVTNKQLQAWIEMTVTPQDAVVMEMTTNTWHMVDALTPAAGQVTVVHPPEVHLITRAQVMTDKKAALILAKLHAAGLLSAVWIPTPEVRALRTLISQRFKMIQLLTQAKCRLQTVLHRHHLGEPPCSDPFTEKQRPWWESLQVEPIEQFRIAGDLDTIAFAETQIGRIEEALAKYAAEDERIPYLVQLPGFGLINSLTVLAAVGDIARFPTAQQLVGYAGLGTKVHDSGESSWSGSITRNGRRDLRRALVEAAQAAVRTHDHWGAIYKRLSKRMHKKKALIAVARKLLVTIWHVLTKREVDRHGDEEQIACAFFRMAYKIGPQSLPDSMSAKAYTRHCLDTLGIGKELMEIPWGSKRFKLPPPRPG